MGRVWERYTEALLARPLLVKGSAAAVIFFASDTATQALTEHHFEWDATRAASGSAFGVAATCWLHYWWNFLEVAFNRYLPAGAYGQNKLVNALGKVVADQLIGAPLYLYSYYCVTYFGTEWMARRNAGATLEAKAESVDATTTEAAGTTTSEEEEEDETTLAARASSLAKETSDRAVAMLPDTLLRHWTLWPIVHTLNFYYNPIHHRVLVQNIVLIFWSGYLSHLNNGGLSNGNDAVSDQESKGYDDNSKIGVVIKTKLTSQTSTTTTSGSTAVAGVVVEPMVASHRRTNNSAATPLATSSGRSA